MVDNSEDRQLTWMVLGIIVLIGSVFVTYSIFEGMKSFEYVGVDWMIESYENFDVYHARFPALDGANLNFNLFLRGDPRKNDVQTSGEFLSFEDWGYVSLSREVEMCRGEVARVMVDFGSFLRSAVGVKRIDVATSDADFANETGMRFVNCNNIFGRSVFMIDVGEAKVVQDDANEFCYYIYVEDCNDISAIEKFMIETIRAHAEVD